MKLKFYEEVTRNEVSFREAFIGIFRICQEFLIWSLFKPNNKFYLISCHLHIGRSHLELPDAMYNLSFLNRVKQDCIFVLIFCRISDNINLIARTACFTPKSQDHFSDYFKW